MSCALFNSEVEEHLAYASTSNTANSNTSMTLHVKTSWASGFPIQQVHTKHTHWTKEAHTQRTYPKHTPFALALLC